MQNTQVRTLSALRQLDMCSVLPDEQLRKLEHASRHRCYQAGERLFQEGDAITHAFIVISGTLKLTKFEPSGDPYIFGLVFPGGVLCDRFKSSQVCSAEAATDLELWRIPIETVEELLNKDAKLERAFLRAAVSEVELRQEWILLLRKTSAYQRVAGFLHFIAKRIGPKDDRAEHRMAFALPLSRREIACFLGMTTETVSRQMTLMKRKAVIELPTSHDNREVIVPNVFVLAAHAAIDFRGSGASALTQ